jgi:uncharacterized protein
MSADLYAAILREHPKGCTIAVRVQPGAKKTQIAGIYGEGEQAALKIALAAPAAEGRANVALIAFMAATLGIPKSFIEILSGEIARNKVLLLHGGSPAEVRNKLSSLLL